ncbi:MAG: PleD family two-component system response regulator [Xenococcaceae cyanobacterium]
MITVLVVDDVPSQKELISIYLRESGYNVIQASNAKEAWLKTVEQKPDVIVTDVVMSGMNGFQLCRKLKKHPATRNLPVVICTSRDQKLDRIWGIRQGADMYLTKPFTQEEIVKAIRSVVS